MHSIFGAPQWAPASMQAPAQPPPLDNCPAAPGPLVPRAPEKFTYDLVKLDNPSVQPPATAETSDTTAGYTFVSGHQEQDLPSLNRILGADNGANPTLNTFYITGLTDGLYRVRVRSNNPNGADALSAWSEPIGTGEAAMQAGAVAMFFGHCGTSQPWPRCSEGSMPLLLLAAAPRIVLHVAAVSQIAWQGVVYPAPRIPTQLLPILEPLHR